jgi:DNA (cytosine-5)-methyltransferase 1
MRVGSLFTGYGGLDIAVGGDLAWYAEIEPAACQVLAHHYPGVPNLGDITAINWADVEPVDVITGGYPCQPFSHAGNRKGKNDVRHLWPNVLDAIRAIRPQYAILENVSGHLTLGFADVLADLAEIGWDAQWGTYRASDVGAPHRRERIFILAHTQHDGSLAGKGRRSLRTDAVQGWEQQQKGSQRESAGSSSSQLAADTSSDGHGQQLHAGAMAGVERQTTRNSQQRERSRSESDSRGADFWGKYDPAITRWELTIGRLAPAPTVGGNDKRRLNPRFVEWMMGLPDGWVTGHGLSAAKELKMLGNGIVPQQAYEAITQLMQRVNT